MSTIFSKVKLDSKRPQEAANKNENDADIDITPMLDVVFIMLIFFVVTASFVKEAGFGLNHPDTADSTEVPETLPIVVELTANNVVRIQNFDVPSVAIKSTIIRLRAERPDAAVVVRVAPETKTNYLVGTVDAIRAAQVSLPTVSLKRT